jgi:cyanophycin synthetase
VRELVDEANRGRALPGVLAVSRLSRLELDDSAVRYLAGHGLTPDSVPAEGQQVQVRSNDNLSTGGVSTDVTARTHPEVRAIAEALARALGVNMAGFDYLTTDISRSWREVPGAFIELNLTPGLAVLTLAGRSPVEVGKLALGSKPGRIPVNIIVLPDAQLAEAESAILQRGPDRERGWASNNKAWLGRMPLVIAKRRPWAGAMTLLSHQVVERALLLASSGQLMRHGLPVDRADRIWLCADDLPDEWLEVLRHASAAPVWHGPWSDMQRTVEFGELAGPEARTAIAHKRP